MTEEELDAAVDVIAAVDAGVLQFLNQRIKQRSKEWHKVGERIVDGRACRTSSKMINCSLWSIGFVCGVGREHFAQLKAALRALVLEAVKLQLRYEPLRETRNKPAPSQSVGTVGITRRFYPKHVQPSD